MRRLCVQCTRLEFGRWTPLDDWHQSVRKCGVAVRVSSGPQAEQAEASLREGQHECNSRRCAVPASSLVVV